MFRRVLFALAGVALAAFLATDRAPKATAADDVTGTWLFSYSARAGFEQNTALIRVQVKDGKAAAVVLGPIPAKGAAPKVTGFEVKDGKTVKFTIGAATFEGTLGKDGSVAVGSYGNDQVAYRAKLARTDKTELAPTDVAVTTPAPDAMTAANKLTSAVNLLRAQAAREKDAEKKKEILDKIPDAEKEVAEKAPGLLREVIAKHAETPFALDAAQALLTNGAKYKVAAKEAADLLALVEAQSTPYGSRFARFQMMSAVEALASQKELAGAAESAAAKLAKAEGAPAAFQSRALTARKLALEALGKTAEAKAVATELVALEAKIDAEYLKTVPPFKPTAFAGRKDKDANRVAVMELFTGAQCPPCVAADVAFDALIKSYKPTDLVLIQYHLHIPGPDPLTNADTVARAKYYGANSTPNTFFNGKAAAAGGGGMANAESKYTQYTGVINPLLEQTTDVKVGGKATRTGDKIDIALEVNGGEGDDMMLRLLVVEENVKYVGGNGLRFHHQVVRAMPLGADGVAIKDKAFKQAATVELGTVRKTLTGYLDDYAAKTRPFPKPERPMDMKALRVIALVQNDKSKEIVQAVQLEVEGKGAGGE